MAKDPAFLFYYQDFLVGTSFMTLEETGAYIKILCLQAAKGILKEEDILKKIPIAIWQAICCNFKKDTNGFYNERLRLEIEKRRVFTESRRKNLHMDNHMASHMRGVLQPHMENENENENEDDNKDKNENIRVIVGEIITDLNLVLGTSYKTATPKTKDLIRARINEGFTVEDFKQVHRKMLWAWGTDEKMVKFLRPMTLYSNKFESYLQQKSITTKLTPEGVKAYLIGQSWLKSQEVIDVK